MYSVLFYVVSVAVGGGGGSPCNFAICKTKSVTEEESNAERLKKDSCIRGETWLP